MLGSAWRSRVRHCRIIPMSSSEGAGGTGGIGLVAVGTVNKDVTADTICPPSSGPSPGGGFGSLACCRTHRKQMETIDLIDETEQKMRNES